MSVARRAAAPLDRFLGRLALMIQRQRGTGVIVVYHRIAPGRDPIYPPLQPDVFDKHCSLLRREFDVVRLSELIERRTAGRSLHRCCAITFDDGYLDFRDHALPVLEAHGLPATQFLITECLETGKPPWDLRLRRAILCAPGSDLSEGGLFARLNRMPAAERDRWLAEHEREIEPSRLTELPKMLQTSDLPRICARGVEIGSQTLSHRSLADVDQPTAQEELADSRTRLGQMLGRQPDFVAYPNGSFTARVERAARDAGYQAGLATGNRGVDDRCNLFAVPRFDVTDRPAQMLRLELSGVIEVLRRLRRRA